jgi:hypothetical protein
MKRSEHLIIYGQANEPFNHQLRMSFLQISFSILLNMYLKSFSKKLDDENVFEFEHYDY